MRNSDTARDQAESDVAVVGGGLAGLTAATLVARAGHSVSLYEAHALGGRARTQQRGDYRFNLGPRALYVGGAAERTLAVLGIHPAGQQPLLTGAQASSRGARHLLPGGAGSLARTKLLSARSKAQVARFMAQLGRLDCDRFVGSTVQEWLAGSGLRNDVAALVRALVRLTTYADAPELLDAGAALEMVQRGVVHGVRYLDGGWASIVEALECAALQAGVAMHAHTPIRSIVEDDGCVQLQLDDGVVSACAVVLALPGPDAVQALVPDLGDLAAGRLGPRVEAACLDLGLRNAPASGLLLGIDQPLYFSCHTPAAKLAPDGHHVVHVAKYLSPDSDSDASRDRAELEAHAVLAGVAEADIVERRFLRRMTVYGGVPLASAGGLRGRPAVDGAALAGLYLAGDWVGAEGMLADASFASAGEAARLACARVGARMAA